VKYFVVTTCYNSTKDSFLVKMYFLFRGLIQQSWVTCLCQLLLKNLF